MNGNETYGGNDREQLLDIIERPDGTYIAAGGSESTLSGEVDSVNVGSRDFWMLHLDLNGDKLNEYRYGSVEFDDMNQVILTNDGGYLLAGSSTQRFQAEIKLILDLEQLQTWIGGLLK